MYCTKPIDLGRGWNRANLKKSKSEFRCANCHAVNTAKHLVKYGKEIKITMKMPGAYDDAYRSRRTAR